MKDCFLKEFLTVVKRKKLSELKNSFYKDLKTIKKELYQSLTTQKYFPTNPEKVRWIYYGIGIAIFFLAGPVGGIMQSPPIIFGLYGSAVIFILFARYMPRKTKKGAETHRHILGLKMYLEKAEKKRLDFFNAPSKKPEIFEQLLPYAMVLGVEKAWAKEFKDMYHTPPDWYEGKTNTFDTIYLTNALNSFSTKANSTLTSTPSSAGSGSSGFSGGFSGGGFGGGGGGSW